MFKKKYNCISIAGSKEENLQQLPYWQSILIFGRPQMTLVHCGSHLFLRGFIFYLCYLYLFMQTGVPHDFHIT